MINVKLLRDNPEAVQASLKSRGCPDDMFTQLQSLDIQWRKEQQKLEELQALKNRSVPKGKPTDEQKATLLELSKQLKAQQHIVSKIKETLTEFSYTVPNILQSDVPFGTDESGNIDIRTVGTPTQFSFIPKPHEELAVDLKLVNFDHATKITGSRFSVFTGLGAKLERAIAAFMLDTHIEQFGYQEVSPPVIVNSASMLGTGQLPKFEDDQYKLSDDYWLSPTAEVQLTNLYRNEIIPYDQLPIKVCAFTQCFRKEAGNYGKDMKGLIRLHQFNKVELVQIVSPDASNDGLLGLLSHAEYILKALKLPYRVVQLCSGDVGFSSSKTYDLEVWFPAQNQYREISSCSNFLDFQANRSKIRYRDQNNNVQNVHTLNGSGLAVGRTFAAILENFQNNSGSIQIPEVLQSYMGVKEIDYET